MPLEKIAKNFEQDKNPKRSVWSYLPIASGVYYHKHHANKNILGYLKHISYPLILTPAKYIVPWLIVGISSGNWSIKNQYYYFKRDKNSIKKEIYKEKLRSSKEKIYEVQYKNEKNSRDTAKF